VLHSGALQTIRSPPSTHDAARHSPFQGFTIIDEQGRNLGLSVPVITLAKNHYKEIHKRKTIVHNQVVEDADTEDALEREKRERYKRECVDINRYSQPTIVTACVFLAIRREKTTHTLKEILGAAKKWAVARKELNRYPPLSISVTRTNFDGAATMSIFSIFLQPVVCIKRTIYISIFITFLQPVVCSKRTN
jgi:hypothetical protein